jgi:hypothetical protein
VEMRKIKIFKLNAQLRREEEEEEREVAQRTEREFTFYNFC